MKSFFRALNAVLSAFFGVRGKKSADKDSATFRPQHVIMAVCAGGFRFYRSLNYRRKLRYRLIF